ncbi:Clavaminate synthase-like protein [Calocera viscosa TUFC12733]|uniref:Clavaminate synthase-like protein n=1 Tax=Calocera viscosa (strain TUFC12733) TaxID=1330018 RepID=A0A167PEV6_CALVF|nr:Clavaminate synthase-like protein [Calocera viscosa TUFC12733]
MSQTATVTQGPTAVLHLRPEGHREFQTIECVPLHPTFGAEIRGLDFSKPIPDDQFDELQRAIGKYGVVVFRKTGLSDEDYVKLGERFGEIAPADSRRFPTKNLGDPSNLYLDGSIVQRGELRWYMAKETALFHKDTTYDARRARYTSIIARQLPPAGTGGATEFGDTRTAYDDLDGATKQLLHGKVGVHSHFHSRRVALPKFPTFAALDPLQYPMHKHDLVIDHLGCPGRKDLFIASHLHHIEGMDEAESSALILRLRRLVEQPKYVLKLYYQQPGDVTIWDNTAVVHRAGGDEGEGWSGKHKRDIRKWMAYDRSVQEWGRNEPGTPKHLAGPVIQEKHNEIYGTEGKVYDFDED